MENNISSRIKELRTSLNMTQTAFAKSIGTSQNALSGYENRDRIPSYDILIAIATKYNVSLDWLCGLSDNKSIDNLPQTLGDILRMIFAIQKSTYLDIYRHDENVNISLDPTYNQFEKLYLYEIGFTNFRLNDYIQEWYKILNLFLDGTIDEEVYSLWIEKTLRKADRYSSFGQFLIDESATE